MRKATIVAVGLAAALFSGSALAAGDVFEACNKVPSGLMSPGALDVCRRVANGDIVDLSTLPVIADPVAEARKDKIRANGGWHDPGAIDLCPQPRRQTRDGCQ
jgi:hypothetical protein